MKKIGLFGGSFDPVHKGHLELAKQVLKDCDLDEVWFILTYSQPLKDGHVESFNNRKKLLEIATKPYKKLKVCDIESKLPAPSYTYNTVKALKKHYPNNQFMWIIGDDQLEHLDKWYQIDKLLEMIAFSVVNRSNIKRDKRFKYVDFKHPASSSAIRNGNFNFLDTSVKEAIYKDQMYFDHILRARLSEKRASHTLRCVDVALEISSFYNIDQSDVFKAVVLHDIAKELDKDVELEIMRKYYPQHLDKHPKIFHQYTGAYLAKKDFCIFDKKILAAIKSHTTGDNTSLLGMITYVADKLERGRPYAVEHYITMCKENIYQGFKIVKRDAEMARNKGVNK